MTLDASVISKPSNVFEYGGTNVPALLINRSIQGYFTFALSINASIDVSEETSAISAIAVDPRRETAFVTLVSSRPTIIIVFAPCRTASSAVA
jgi:hypothetical protein